MSVIHTQDMSAEYEKRTLQQYECNLKYLYIVMHIPLFLTVCIFYDATRIYFMTNL